MTREFWGEFKRNNIGIIGIDRANKTTHIYKEAIVKDIIAEKFPEIESTYTKILDAQRVFS